MYPVIPGFNIIKKLGEGAMARVFLAIDEDLDRQVAIKVMNEEMAHDQDLRDRFVHEAKDTAKFDHEGIVKIFATGGHQDTPYLVLEYLEAGTLKSNLKARLKHRQQSDAPNEPIFSEVEALQLLKILAEALAYAHNKGVIHRDIKPDNILFRSNGCAVLSDFGIAKTLDSDRNLTMVGSAIGTPAYMSPEQMQGAEIDGRSDIYSLGVVFWEMLTGQRPYRTTISSYDEIFKQMDEPVPKLAENLSHLQALLQKLVAKRPENRFQTASELSRAVSMLSQTFTSTTDGETVVQPVFTGGGKQGKQPQNWPRLHQKKLASLAAVAALIIVGVLVMLEFGKEPSMTVEPVDKQTEKLITELIESAQTYLEFDYIITPPVSNAAQNFTRVLELQPGNKKALTGLILAETALIKQVDQEMERGNWNMAKSMIELGLYYFPDSEQLADLLKQASQE